jgi:hypothetical protein
MKVRIQGYIELTKEELSQAIMKHVGTMVYDGRVVVEKMWLTKKEKKKL